VLALEKDGKYSPGRDNKDGVSDHYFGKGEATTAGIEKGS
jgi:hypothetical protein